MADDGRGDAGQQPQRRVQSGPDYGPAGGADRRHPHDGQRPAQHPVRELLAARPGPGHHHLRAGRAPGQARRVPVQRGRVYGRRQRGFDDYYRHAGQRQRRRGPGQLRDQRRHRPRGRRLPDRQRRTEVRRRGNHQDVHRVDLERQRGGHEDREPDPEQPPGRRDPGHAGDGDAQHHLRPAAHRPRGEPGLRRAGLPRPAQARGRRGRPAQLDRRSEQRRQHRGGPARADQHAGVLRKDRAEHVRWITSAARPTRRG